MNSRQRFAATMSGEQPDRLPLLEEGLRDGVLEQWQSQGLGQKEDLKNMFEFDSCKFLPVDLEPRPRIGALPATRRDLKDLLASLDPKDPARIPKDWNQRAKAWQDRSHLLKFSIHRGFFLSLGIRNSATFTQMIQLLCDDPGLITEIMEIYTEAYVHLVDGALEKVEIDFAVLSEPIADNHGPLISPRMYKEFVLRAYAPILEVLRQTGVQTIVFMTYGNARLLLPAVLEAGFDCLWACEVETKDMDYLDLRREFGKSLKLIGGIDLDVLFQDKAAIQREMETKVPPLLDQGGYVPLADGRVRENIPFENYLFYRTLLEKLVRG